MTMRIAVLMIAVLLRKKITRKFRLVDPKFDGYPDPRIFSDWLANMGATVTVMRCLTCVRFNLLG